MSRVLLLAILVSIGASACERTASPSTQEGPGATRFEELRITTPDSVELYVRVVGTGPDTVIVGLAAWLARDLTPLAAGRTLIFYDPRSRGGSDAVLCIERFDPALDQIPNLAHRSFGPEHKLFGIAVRDPVLCKLILIPEFDTSVPQAHHVDVEVEKAHDPIVKDRWGGDVDVDLTRLFSVAVEAGAPPSLLRIEEGRRSRCDLPAPVAAPQDRSGAHARPPAVCVFAQVLHGVVPV